MEQFIFCRIFYIFSPQVAAPERQSPTIRDGTRFRKSAAMCRKLKRNWYWRSVARYAGSPLHYDQNPKLAPLSFIKGQPESHRACTISSPGLKTNDFPPKQTDSALTEQAIKVLRYTISHYLLYYPAEISTPCSWQR